ncbi:hypothetical protein NDU88_005026 [Pleurodeles waltl]|uniref:Uncharacterized protein n=1 Tax=Pleurodeles waltl TaxID=8319 RepID=A0AAV7MDD3_PLEWA|nr:hypothetical protein NDU88_005026 [Pleurodeles waltl]
MCPFTFLKAEKDTNQSSGEVCWFRAALELRRSRKTAAHVSLQGSGANACTSTTDAAAAVEGSSRQRSQALEEKVGVMKEELGKNKEDIQLLKCSEQEMQDKLE